MIKKNYRSYLTFLLLLPAFAWGQKNKPDSRLLLQQIKTEMNGRNNYPYALSLAQTAVKYYPNDVDFQFLLGRLYMLNRDTLGAERKMDEIIAKVPSYKDAYPAAANIQLAKGNRGKALHYLNMGIQRFPRDRDLRLKKLALYAAAGNYRDGNLQADSLISSFPRDTGVVNSYINYHNEAGTYYLKRGDLAGANREFNLVLTIDPNNKDALSGNLSALMQSGNDQNSLAFINEVLLHQPDSYELLKKKLGLLQDMRRYPEAIETLQYMEKKYPDDGSLRQLEPELKLEAARYYRKMDPYYEYQSVLDKSPANREALDNVINIAISRGMEDEALYWINKALVYNKNDKELLRKKMSLLEQSGKYSAAALVSEQLMQAQPSEATRATFIDMELAVAKDFSAQQLYDSALLAYRSILHVDPRQEQALNSSINILSEQKNYTAALDLVNETISYYPDDVQLQIKKAGILQDAGQYDRAAELFRTLYLQRPQNLTIKNGLVDAWLSAGRQMMQAQDYDHAKDIYDKVQAIVPDNKEVLNNLINIELAQGDTGASPALQWCDTALSYYPSDRDFLLKKSEALFSMKRYEDAIAISDSLRTRYPYNTTVKGLYTDQLTAAASAYQRAGDSVASERSWRELLKIHPKDTLALLALINYSQQQKRYDQALELSDTALSDYPDNTIFILKKATALESLHHYSEAADVAAMAAKRYPDNSSYADYVAYLRGKTYHQEIGLAFLSSHFDSAQAANIATLQYSYLGKKWTMTGKLNFAGRSVGTGLQLELESYIYHGTKWYSYADLGVANKLVFPSWRAAYSLFHSFAGTWEAELGGRYMDFDSLNSVSAVASVSHYFGDFWVNMRGYAISLSGKQYSAATLTARQYLNNKTDYFFATAGYGNSPDDFSRLYQFSQSLRYTTYSIGAGYQKMFNYRNIISISGTWYNQKIGISNYRNQYDIYLTFFRKF